MPTYDYRCAACGHALEIFHGISEKPRRTCPKCKKPRLERLISAGAGLLFKGSGFYLTDYRSASYKAGEKRERSASAPAATASGDSKTPAAPESKPAAGAPESGSQGSAGDASPAAPAPKGAKRTPKKS